MFKSILHRVGIFLSIPCLLIHSAWSPAVAETFRPFLRAPVVLVLSEQALSPHLVESVRNPGDSVAELQAKQASGLLQSESNQPIPSAKAIYFYMGLVVAAVIFTAKASKPQFLWVVTVGLLSYYFYSYAASFKAAVATATAPGSFLRLMKFAGYLITAQLVAPILYFFTVIALSVLHSGASALPWVLFGAYYAILGVAIIVMASDLVSWGYRLWVHGDLMVHHELALKKLRVLKESSRSDPLLKIVLNRIGGLQPTWNYWDVEVGGKDYLDRTIQYVPWMARIPGYLEYLIIRRAIGFYFDDTVADIASRSGAVQMGAGDQYNLWTLYSSYELIRRPQYFKIIYFAYVLPYTVFQVSTKFILFMPHSPAERFWYSELMAQLIGNWPSEFRKMMTSDQDREHPAAINGWTIGLLLASLPGLLFSYGSRTLWGQSMKFGSELVVLLFVVMVIHQFISLYNENRSLGLYRAEALLEVSS